MRSICLAAMMGLGLIAGCGFQSKPAERSLEESSVAPPSSAPVESTPSREHRSLASVAGTHPLSLPTIEWTPEGDREQHLRYHWPETFKLPIDIQIVPPRVPPRVEGPSPPIKPTS